MAALITLAGTYYFWVRQRSRRELGYEILSANVIIPKLPKKTPDIQVMVKSSLLSGHAEGMMEYKPVEEILGFRVRIRNTGNQVLENQQVRFTMDEKARIISIEPEETPDLGGRAIHCTAQDSTSNVALAELPFLNPGQQVIFSLQSVDNAGTSCSVSAGAPGLRYFDMQARRHVVSFTVSGLVLVVLATPAGILKLLDLSGQAWVSDSDALDIYIGFAIILGFLPMMIFLRTVGDWLEDLTTRRRIGGKR